MPHKAHVVIKLVEIVKSLVEKLLVTFGALEIYGILGVVIKKIVKTAKEAAGPPITVLLYVKSALVNTVRNLIP